MSDPDSRQPSTLFTPEQAGIARVAPPVLRPCPNCSLEFGDGEVCHFCGQVASLPRGVRVASPARRLGSALLDLALVSVTLVIGWLIWAIFTSKNGQSPAKSILGLRVVKLSYGADGRAIRTATRGQMLIRWLAKRLLWLIYLVGILAALWLLWDKNRQALWDKMVSTLVVKDPMGLLVQPVAQESWIPTQPPSPPVVPPPPPGP